MPVPNTKEVTTRTSLSDIAAEAIRAAIFDGTLAPGEVLQDSELQEWLGVSRTPIREALGALSRLGLIEMAPQRRTRVAIPRPEDRTLILQTVGALMGGIVRVTTPVLTSTQRGTLINTIDSVISVVEARDYVQHGIDGQRLLDLFMDYCPNPILVAATKDTVGSLAYQLRVTRTAANTSWIDLDAGYPALKEALQAADPVAAELAIERAFRLSTPLNTDTPQADGSTPQ